MLQRTCNTCFEGLEHDADVLCDAHPTCKECFSRFAQFAIQDGKAQIQACLVGGTGCGNPGVLPTSALAARLGAEWMARLEHNQLGTGNACSKCGSHRLCVQLRKSGSAGALAELRCSKCHYASCLACRQYIEPSSLSRAKARWLWGARWWRQQYGGIGEDAHSCGTEDLNEFRVYVQNPANNVKPCPHCFKLCYRFSGCAHMTCNGIQGCQKKWCWNCLAKEHHSDSECFKASGLHYRPAVLSFGRKACVACGYGLGALGKLSGLVLLSPLIVSRKVSDYWEQRKWQRYQQLVRLGIDVYVERDGSEFVERFARDVLHRGRWEKKCFLSYASPVVVRVHAHGLGEAECECALQVQGALSAHLNPTSPPPSFSCCQPPSAGDQVAAACRKLGLTHLF